MTIVEFLEARIAEDEAKAAGLLANTQEGYDINDYAERMLAECAAKRAIIDQWEDLEGIGPLTGGVDAGHALGIDAAVRALAAVYKDHPDYQQEWANG